MKILTGTSSFSELGLKKLEDYGFEVVVNPYKRKMTEEEIILQLQDVDGLLAGLEPLNEKVLKSTNKLKAVARVGIGMSNVDIEAASKLGIKVSNTPDGPTDAVAEATLTAMLSLTREFHIHIHNMHQQQWEKRVSLGLKGTNILIIGYGRIGKKVHELLKPFKPNVKIVDPFVENELTVTLEEGLKFANVITIHASGEEAILKEKHFIEMNDGVYILNASRGALIEEKALLEAVENKKVGGLWLDTYWTEPYAGELTKFPQALLTPHVCTYTKVCRESMESEAIENLINDLKE